MENQKPNELSDRELRLECLKQGGLINPMLEVPRSNVHKEFEIESKYYPATEVKFKVGLTETDETGTKKGIGVFLSAISVGAEEKKENNIQSITSIEFSVNVVFPYLTRKGEHFDLTKILGVFCAAF